MGSRLTFTSVVGMAFISATALAQPGPLPAADLAKQGTDLYNAGNFAGAVDPLEKAVALEPNNFDYRFTLAQAYRQSGHCDKAMPIYKALVDAAPDPAKKTQVETNMGQCPVESVTTAPTAPAPAPQPPAPPPEPTVVHSSISSSTQWMLMGSGAAVGAGAILLLSGLSDSSDADKAARYSDHESISHRATTEYIVGATAVGVGVALGVIAVMRIKHAKDDTSISFKPRSGGGSFVLERTW